MKLLNNTTRKVLALAVGVLVAALLALAALLYLLQQDGNQLRETLQVFVGKQVHEQEYLSLDSTLRATESERAELRSLVLVGDADTVTFLSELDQLAAAVGTRLTTEQLEVRTIEPGRYDVLDITLEIEGTERAVVNMLTLLETLPRHSYLTSVLFERLPASAAAPVRVTATLAVTFIEE